MAAIGFRRYSRLFRHIANPLEYVLKRGQRRRRPLLFITRPHQLHFAVTDSVYQVFKELFMQDVYEIDTLVNQLPRHPVVIDIGANVGFFATQLLSKVETAVLYAFEPVPANVHLFQQTIDRNPRLRTSIRLFAMAVVGMYRPSVQLFAEEINSGQVVASVLSDFHQNNTRVIDVPCITLTAVIEQNKLTAIDLLKIDCEGSEYDILYNTAPDLLNVVQHIVMEVHNLDTSRNNVNALAKYLQEVGFTVTHAPINDWCHSLEATR